MREDSGNNILVGRRPSSAEMYHTLHVLVSVIGSSTSPTGTGFQLIPLVAASPDHDHDGFRPAAQPRHELPSLFSPLETTIDGDGRAGCHELVVSS
jgi:hypothetical protein